MRDTIAAQFVGDDFPGLSSMTPDRSAEKSLGILRPKLDAPKADRFVADRNTPFGEHVFDISVAEIESMIQPDGVANDAVHRKNNHPKRAGRQVRLEIGGSIGACADGRGLGGLGFRWLRRG